MLETPAQVPLSTSHSPEDNPHNLTRREIEVLQLIAEGLTDAQVAARLVLSTRTVQAHLRSIYSKLDVTTRSAATRYAMEHGLEARAVDDG
jgi:DNA-binding NarL/FixJ family response regulator